MVTKKKLPHWIIGMFLMFIFGYICPTWSVVTRLGVKMLGVFLGWLVLSLSGYGLLVPSLLAMLACILTGYYDAEAVIASVGSSTMYLLVCIFIMVHFFAESKTGEYLVRWLLSRKIFKGKPYLLTFAFLLTMELIGTIIGALGIIVLTIAILKSLADVLGMEKGDPWFRFLLLCVVAFSGTAELALPFKATAIFFMNVFNGVLNSSGLAINPMHHLVVGVVTILLNAVLSLLLAKFAFRFDLEKVRAIDGSALQDGEFKKIKPSQVIVLVLTVLGFFYPVIIMVFPAAIYEQLNAFGQGMFMTLCICLLAFLRIGGEKVVDIGDAFARGISWDAIFAGGAISLVGSALGASATGFSDWMLQLFGPMFSNLGIVGTIILLVVISCVVTQVFSNLATGLLLSYIIAPLCIQFNARGFNISIFPALISIGAMSACLLPSGGGTAAVALGSDIFRDDPKWTLRHGIPVLVAAIVSLVISGIICAYVL